MHEKLSISLPAEMVRAIKEKVDAGAYSTASEVIREAMRVWQRQEEEHVERIEAIRARVRRSLEDPRPSLSQQDAEAEMSRFLDEMEKDSPYAGS